MPPSTTSKLQQHMKLSLQDTVKYPSSEHLKTVVNYHQISCRFMVLVFPLEQAYYLEFLPRDNTSISLPPCDDCSSDEILLPDGLPIGGYFHQSAYVSFNEHVSTNILEFTICCVSSCENRTSSQSYIYNYEPSLRLYMQISR